jgi:hypothetical protein
VIVGDLDAVGVSASPLEADPPLVINADAVLTISSADQLLEPVARRDA